MGEVLEFAARSEDLSAESKRVGRKRLAVWLRAVDAKIEARELISFDARLARALTKFPSSTLEGHCWVGQARLSRSLACSGRTAQRSLARLKCSGLLLISQRGAGRTARYIFCVDATPVFPGLKRFAVLCNPKDIAARGEGVEPSAPCPSDPSTLAGQAPPDVASQDPPDVARLTQSASPKMAKESSKELQTDSFQTTTNLYQSSLQPKTAATSAIGERKQATDEDKPSIQVIQNAIVNKLGKGDIAQGWLLFGDLPVTAQAELEALERRDALTDVALSVCLAAARGPA
jgi:hypothetical protein